MFVFIAYHFTLNTAAGALWVFKECLLEKLLKPEIQTAMAYKLIPIPSRP